MVRHIIYGHQENVDQSGNRVVPDPEAVGPHTIVVSGVTFTPVGSKFGSEVVWGDDSWRTLVQVVWDVEYPEARAFNGAHLV